MVRQGRGVIAADEVDGGAEIEGGGVIRLQAQCDSEVLNRLVQLSDTF